MIMVSAVFTVEGTKQRREVVKGGTSKLVIAQVVMARSPRASLSPPVGGKHMLDGYYRSQLCYSNFCGQYYSFVIYTSFTKTSINTS